jgi:hypothetical protein
MDNQILGFDRNVVYIVLILILLVSLGILSFHYYVFVSGKNGIQASTGIGFSLLADDKQKQ